MKNVERWALIACNAVAAVVVPFLPSPAPAPQSGRRRTENSCMVWMPISQRHNNDDEHNNPIWTTEACSLLLALAATLTSFIRGTEGLLCCCWYYSAMDSELTPTSEALPAMARRGWEPTR